MKKVEVKTECGEETTFYVAQDVDTVTIDGEKWIKKPDKDENKKDDRLPLEGRGIPLRKLVDKLREDDAIDRWNVEYIYDENTESLKIDMCGYSLPNRVFQTNS